MACHDLQCVVRSYSAITAVDVVKPSNAPASDEAASTFDAFPPQLLVAVASGNLWLVTLPSSGQLSSRGGIACQLWLQQSPGLLRLSSTAPSAGLSPLSAGITPTQFPGVLTSQSGSDQVKLMHQVPGAVGIERVPLLTATVTVVRSVIAPTTVIFTAVAALASTHGDEDDADLDLSIELDDLEGEQSTCSWSVHGSDTRFSGLLASLFSEDAGRVQDKLFVIQGDSDGCTRFAMLPLPFATQRPATLRVGSSGTLVESIGEPVAAIIPFSTVAAVTAVHGESPRSCDALLVCGVNGRLAIFSSTLSEANAGQSVQPKSRCFQRLQLCQGSAIQSIAVMQRLAVLVYCSQGTTSVCSCAELMTLACEHHGAASANVVSVDRIARKLPLPAASILSASVSP